MGIGPTKIINPPLTLEFSCNIVEIIRTTKPINVNKKPTKIVS
jgi:hypothetical protein